MYSLNGHPGCDHCILQRDTHFDSGYLCDLKPVESKYGPYYERIDTSKCFECGDYAGGQ